MVRKYIANHLVLLIVIFSGFFSIAHFFIASQSLSDGTYFDIDANWNDGIPITVINNSELQNGDLLQPVLIRYIFFMVGV